MATIIQPNGKPGKHEIIWDPVLKWVAGILAAWVVAAGAASIAAYTRLAVLERVVTDHVSSVGPGTMHEGPDAKRQRIREEIERYHRGKP